TPKAIDTLLVLVQNSGRMVGKDELMKQIWPDSFVEEANLAVNISTLRKALGEDRHEHRYIVTVPGRGYRFVAQVRELWDERPELIVAEQTNTEITIEEEEQAATEADEERRARSHLARVADLPTAAGSIARRRQQMRRLAWPIACLALALMI